MTICFDKMVDKHHHSSSLNPHLIPSLLMTANVGKEKVQDLTLLLVTESKQRAEHIAFWVISATFTRRRVSPSIYGDSLSQRMAVANCQHYTFQPMYFWSRYPIPTTKFWNLLELFDPPSYFLTWFTLTLVVIVMKILTKYGARLGLAFAQTEILCVPFQ